VLIWPRSSASSRRKGSSIFSVSRRCSWRSSTSTSPIAAWSGSSERSNHTFQSSPAPAARRCFDRLSMSFENQIPARHMINPSAIGFMATIKRQPLILGNEYRHDGGCDVSSKSSLTVGGTFDDGGARQLRHLESRLLSSVHFISQLPRTVDSDAADVSVTCFRTSVSRFVATSTRWSGGTSKWT
jgi:hypothetical protein